ncbi:uncharacterized protein K02A2.6-like [Cylas formicarius]|uniref:uncharacterized protein K02A2.6-like n=1 Tax=Cylas formicarius TaxID=197179 RepID=UPI002958BCCA|nr:uncharacterized protein K02A2.6-like [Cylas formicarius]
MSAIQVIEPKASRIITNTLYAQRFETLSIDLFGPLPEGPHGEKWTFIVEDNSSKWVALFALKRVTAEECARTLIDEVFFRYGLPRKVISDNGVQFVSAVMQQVCYILDIKETLIPLYHASANMVERKNRDLKPRLAMLVKEDHGSWPEKLATIRFAMNSAWNETTKHSAAYLTFGRELRTLDDINKDFRVIANTDNFVPQIAPYLQKIARTWNEAKESHEKHQDRHKQYADSRRSNPPTFQLKDRVWVKTHALSNAAKGVTAKFYPKRDGPYEIIRVVSPTSYEVASPDDLKKTLGVYHVSSLTPVNSAEDEKAVVSLKRRGRPPKKISGSSSSRVRN